MDWKGTPNEAIHSVQDRKELRAMIVNTRGITPDDDADDDDHDHDDDHDDDDESHIMSKKLDNESLSN